MATMSDAERSEIYTSTRYVESFGAEAGLSERDYAFVKSIRQQGYPLSEKQKNWLARIATRLHFAAQRYHRQKRQAAPRMICIDGRWLPYQSVTDFVAEQAASGRAPAPAAPGATR
jgi:hypothetical protein